MIVSTFGPEGPTKCSGLDVVRYDAESFTTSLARILTCLIIPRNCIGRRSARSSSFFIVCAGSNETAPDSEIACLS